MGISSCSSVMVARVIARSSLRPGIELVRESEAAMAAVWSYLLGGEDDWKNNDDSLLDRPISRESHIGSGLMASLAIARRPTLLGGLLPC